MVHPPHLTVLWKRLISSNCQMWNEVLACVPRMGLGVVKIPAAAGARIKAPRTQALRVPMCPCCCSSSCWQHGHREAEQQPQGAGRRPGRPGLRGAAGSPGGRRKGNCLKIPLKGAGRACTRRHLSLVPSHAQTLAYRHGLHTAVCECVCTRVHSATSIHPG